MKSQHAYYGHLVAVQKIMPRSEEWIADDEDGVRYAITLSNGRFSRFTRLPGKAKLAHRLASPRVENFAIRHIYQDAAKYAIDKTQIINVARKHFRKNGMKFYNTLVADGARVRPMMIQMPHMESDICDPEHMDWEPYRRWQQDLLIATYTDDDLRTDKSWLEPLFSILDTSYAKVGIDLGLFEPTVNTAGTVRKISILDKFPAPKVFY